MKPVNGLKLLAVVIIIIVVIGIWLSDKVAVDRGKNWLHRSSYWSRYSAIRQEFLDLATKKNYDNEKLQAILGRRNDIINHIRDDIPRLGIDARIDQPQWLIDGPVAPDPKIRIYRYRSQPKQPSGANGAWFFIFKM